MSNEIQEHKREQLNQAIKAIDEHIKELQELKEKFIKKIEEANRIKTLLE